MGKIEITHNTNIDMEHLIEAVDMVKHMADEIRVDLLSENNDIDCFIFVDSIGKALTQAQAHTEQLKWVIRLR